MLFVAKVTDADIPAPIDTRLFTMTDDPAGLLVDGVDCFLLRKLDQAKELQLQRWQQSYNKQTSQPPRIHRNTANSAGRDTRHSQFTHSI